VEIVYLKHFLYRILPLTISVFFYVMFQIFVIYFIYVAKNFIKGLVAIFKVQQGSIPKLNWETVL